MKLKTVFINELGNRVTVKADTTEASGVRPHTEEKVSYSAIRLSLKNGDSTTENIMTLKEVEQIHQLLTEVLDKYGNRSAISKVAPNDSD